MARYVQISSILALLFLGAATAAEGPEAKGLRIAKTAEQRNNGFVGEKSDMKLTLIDAYGAKTVREMQGKVMEVPGDGDKSLSIFLNPKDVKGTKMLTWSHKLDDDDQWLYMPTVRRVKRISSRNKSASFMGSEFSYEDLGSQEVEKYSYKWLKDSQVDGKPVWVLERKPKKKSGYSKQIIYMDQKLHNPLQIEYYDRKGELLKIANFDKYKSFKVNGKTLWRTSGIHMKNVQTKKESIINWANQQLGVNFKEREFKKNSLK